MRDGPVPSGFSPELNARIAPPFSAHECHYKRCKNLYCSFRRTVHLCYVFLHSTTRRSYASAPLQADIAPTHEATAVARFRCPKPAVPRLPELFPSTVKPFLAILRAAPLLPAADKQATMLQAGAASGRAAMNFSSPHRGCTGSEGESQSQLPR